MIRPLRALALLVLLAAPLGAQSPRRPVADAAPRVAPLVIGETALIPSKALGETRRVNVYRSYGYMTDTTAALSVLYMPDGGLGEDFLHVAGLLEVLVGNGGMRPFMVVGIENTQRRRDLTGPTDVESDRRIAPVVGGSAQYRAFLRDELVPWVKARYRTTGETAIVGESLAGLFVVETFLREPALFDTYVAIDPSLWWNDRALVKAAPTLLAERSRAGKRLWMAASDEWEIASDVARLATVLQRGKFDVGAWSYVPFADETHATIYHPAALRAFRELFAPDSTRR